MISYQTWAALCPLVVHLAHLQAVGFAESTFSRPIMLILGLRTMGKRLVLPVAIG